MADRIKNTALWILGIGLIITMWAFSSGKMTEQKMNGLQVTINFDDGYYFVNKEDVTRTIKNILPGLDTLRLIEINSRLLEETLENHPSIAKAEVYSALNGNLRIDVYQRKPIARIQNGGLGFYLDEEGKRMPLSNNFSAGVPLITGFVADSNLVLIHDFLIKSANDSFYKDFFAGIDIDKNNQWKLYPKAGNHSIMMGDPTDADKKLNKLETFYRSAVDEKSFKNLKTIDLRYNKQVISTKH